MLIQLTRLVAGCVGAGGKGDGTYRLDFTDGKSRDATGQEVAEALAIAETESTEHKVADAQQNAGIIEAKRAYARMQTIIDNADTATTVQLRAAIKEIARDVQHLIRAAVR